MSWSATPVYYVDTFTAEPFRGNTAAVCLLPELRDAEAMQQVAAELKHSDTAFVEVSLDREANAPYPLRWFTPTAEVSLCGHATLAAAVVLREEGYLNHDRIRFDTRSGVLECQLGEGGYALRLPARPVAEAALPEAWRGRLPPEAQLVGRNEDDWLLRLADEAAVRRFQPDLALLAEVEARGLIVTATGDDCDFVQRFFAPRIGIDEDPVTGSAWTATGPYWGAQLGRATLSSRQCSARGGEAVVHLVESEVVLEAQAVTVLRGILGR